MKLAASVIVRNELGRYLEPCIDHLAEFCDLIVVWDDGSEDDTIRTLAGRHDAMRLHGTSQPGFFAHEGQTRQRLLEATLSWEPTHVLAIDADEFVADGPGLRAAVEQRPDLVAFRLDMQEVWEASEDGLCIRFDGGWRPHGIPAVWRVPANVDDRPGGGPSWRIADRALACGRVPAPIDNAAAYLGLFAEPVTGILHFGWANEQERQARYDRYAEHDRGRFHASQHLQSILAPCDRVTLRPRDWPAGLDAYKAQILERANGARA